MSSTTTNIPGEASPIVPILQAQNDSPKIATADGGVIGASSITYDSNAKATGKIGSFPTQSWMGDAYTDGSVNQVVFTPTNMATTLWTQVGANPSGQSTASRSWYFKLVLQNAFTCTPDEPQELEDFTTNITYDATAIKEAALQALQAAYSGVPVIVSEGTPGTGDVRVTVLNHQTIDPNPLDFGATDPNNPAVHQIDYINNMEQGQLHIT
jgi:hypothetical protein